jgi:hypothetical protein
VLGRCQTGRPDLIRSLHDRVWLLCMGNIVPLFGKLFPAIRSGPRAEGLVKPLDPPTHGGDIAPFGMHPARSSRVAAGSAMLVLGWRRRLLPMLMTAFTSTYASTRCLHQASALPWFSLRLQPEPGLRLDTPTRTSSFRRCVQDCQSEWAAPVPLGKALARETFDTGLPDAPNSERRLRS